MRPAVNLSLPNRRCHNRSLTTAIGDGRAGSSSPSTKTGRWSPRLRAWTSTARRHPLAVHELGSAVVSAAGQRERRGRKCPDRVKALLGGAQLFGARERPSLATRRFVRRLTFEKENAEALGVRKWRLAPQCRAHDAQTSSSTRPHRARAWRRPRSKASSSRRHAVGRGRSYVCAHFFVYVLVVVYIIPRVVWLPTSTTDSFGP